MLHSPWLTKRLTSIGSTLKWAICSLLLLSSSTISQSFAQTILLNDTFSRSGALNGTRPNTDTINSNWVVNGNSSGAPYGTVITNGSVATVTANNTETVANLAFTSGTLASNTLYTLSTTVNVTSTGGWIGIGFSTDSYGSYGAGTSYWEILSSNAYSAWVGPGTTQELATGPVSSGTSAVLKITVNTANKLVTYYLNGAVQAAFPLATVPNLLNVFVDGHGPVTGTVDNFQVTTTPAAVYPFPPSVFLSDSFSRITTDLDTTAPDVDLAFLPSTNPDLAAWIVNGSSSSGGYGTISTDGSVANIRGTTGTETVGNLAFGSSTAALASNTIYTLTANEVVSSTTGWEGIGFSTDIYGSYGAGTSYWICLSSTGGYSAWAGPGTTTEEAVGTSSTGGTSTLGISIDTSTGTVSFLVNGSAVKSFVVSPLPNLTNVFVDGHGSVTASLGNFTLTKTPVTVVPSKPMLGLLPSSTLTTILGATGSDPMKGMYASLQTDCASFMKKSITPYTDWHDLGSNGALYYRGRILSDEVLELALMANLTQSTNSSLATSYANQAIGMLTSVAAEVDPNCVSWADGPLMVGDTAHAFSVGLDWLWSYMTTAQKTTVLAAVNAYGEWINDNSVTSAYGAVDQSHEAWNWNGVLHGSLGMCAMWTGHTDWLNLAQTRCIEHLQQSVDSTGMPWEGLGYCCYGKLDVFPFMEAERIQTGTDYLAQAPQQSLLQRMGTAFRELYIPGDNTVFSFNQTSGAPYAIGMFLDLIARNNDTRGMWWWNQVYGAVAPSPYNTYGQTSPGAGASLPYCMIWCKPTQAAAAPPAGTENMVFSQGLVVSRTGYTPTDSLMSFTSTSSLPNIHHHLDQGNVNFYVEGEGFAIPPGATDTTGTDNNVMMFGGICQDPNPGGGFNTCPLKRDALDSNGAWYYTQGDLHNAYAVGAGIAVYYRQTAFWENAQQPYVAIYDGWTSQSGTIADAEFVMITAGGNKVSQLSASQWKIAGALGKASCTVAFSSANVSLTIDTTSVPGSQRLVFKALNPAGSLFTVLAATLASQTTATTVSFPSAQQALVTLPGNVKHTISLQGGLLQAAVTQ